MSGSTTSEEFFEAMYREKPDPWNFAQSDYERSRYDTILGALDRRAYGRAFEPGCSVGELTWRLARRCGLVDGMDISATAAQAAKERCREFANVTIRVGALPHQIPDGDFDLIVFSEMGYYFEATALAGLGDVLVQRLRASGTLLAAHWLGTSKDHLLSGDHVHELLGDLVGLRLEHSERHTQFRLDRWIRV